MAGPYYVDDGGDGSDGLSWAKAYTSIKALDDAVALGAGEIVYFGHDSNDQNTHSAHLTIVGPAGNANPVSFISVTQGTTTYQKGTGSQIDTTEGAYDITFDGSFAIYGLNIVAGGHIGFSGLYNEALLFDDCTFAPGNAKKIDWNNTGYKIVKNCIIDLAADTGATAVGALGGTGGNLTEFNNCSFSNATNRTGAVIATSTMNGTLIVSGCDFSGFTNATACEIVSGTDLIGTVQVNNCKTVATPTLIDTATPRGGQISMYEVGPTYNPTQVLLSNRSGTVQSVAIDGSGLGVIYRTGGATVAGFRTAWLVTTTAYAFEAGAIRTPYLYGSIAAAGTKTFTVYITNDTGDFTDAEVWLEVEYLATSASPKWTLVTDRRATSTTDAAAQTDDTTSTWNGTGPSFTYKQSLVVSSVSVGQAGQYRARVAIGLASIAASRYFYIDPKVTVS